MNSLLLKTTIVGIGISVFAFGAKNPTPTPGTAGEVAIASVVAPAGAAFQLRASLTEPRPIWSTGADAGAFSLNGFAVWGPGGDTTGVAWVRNGNVQINALSPTGNLGNGLDYPFAILNLNVPKLKPGTKAVLDLAGLSMNTAAGPLAVTTKPGTLTVGGSVYISGIFPGGGTLPAGSSVKIRGGGFLPNTKLTATLRINTQRFISAEEIEITLKEATVMDLQKISATNPDGSSATVFSYLRGKMQATPTRLLLQSAEPGFQLQTHALATVTVPALESGQFVGLALQNPNPGPVVVTLTSGAQSAMIVMKSGDRVMDELGALLNGMTLNPGDTVNVVSTAFIQILGIQGDDNTQALKPFLPVF